MNGSTRRLLIAAAALGLGAPAAQAWKPRTHVYLAEQAMADALDDGKVTLYEVDPATNRLKRGPDGGPVKVGDYAVDPRVLEALKTHPRQFRAGVLGPDAFPDILTGQQIIHPAGKVTPGETGVDLNLGGPGPDAWMRHLWGVAYGPNGPDATPATRAFVAGFLAHAAGDLYGHTCVNHYSGDSFNFKPQPMNAVRHIVVEGYFDKHVPNPTFESSIDGGVDGFILRQMILGRPGTPVEKLHAGDNIKLTLAAHFSQIRNRLARDVQGHADINPAVAYKKRWIEDIDRGLEALPAVSHRLAVALMFNPAGKADTAAARKIATDYAEQHLLSMAGLPDAAGATLVLFEKAVQALGIPGLKEFVADVKRDALNAIVKSATGMSVDDFKKHLEVGPGHFNEVMDRPPLENGHRATQAEFDAKELHLAQGSGWVDYRQVPPAYNTVALIKLALMSQAEVNRLMADLGSAERLAEGNAMLGFAETLDGSNQWRVNPRKLVVARHPAGYTRLFMKQNGEDRPVNPPQVAGFPNVDYKVTIKTGDKFGAGTDANIFLTIVGKRGSTGEHKLNGLISGNAFERNQTDTLTLKDLPDVGELEAITVRSDDFGPASDWLLDHVVVLPGARPAVRFDCDAWLKGGHLTQTLRRKP